MTASRATARVWLSTLGVVTGILLSRHGVSLRLALGCAIAGALLVACRRRPTLGLIGIVLVASGLAAARPPVEPAYGETWGGAPAQAFRGALSAGLEGAPDGSAALLAGLTIGETSGVDAATTESFRRSGLSHLVAVSGSNVAMVLAAIAIVTVRLPLMVRGGLALLGLTMYVIVVGPEPSVLRAAAMGVVGLIAYVAGRDAASLNSLGIALVAVLGAKPELLFAVGLHLSAAATLGIVVWSRSIERALVRIPALLRAPIAITVAAQVAVSPLLIGSFERFSLVAPLANVLAAPAVPPATVIGLSSGIVALASPAAGRVVGAVAGPFAGWILWVAGVTARWSWSSIEVPAVWGWITGVPVGFALLVGAVRRPS